MSNWKENKWERNVKDCVNLGVCDYTVMAEHFSAVAMQLVSGES